MRPMEALTQLDDIDNLNVVIDGDIHIHQWRCWIVDRGSAINIGSQQGGILIHQPGLVYQLGGEGLVAAGGKVVAIPDVSIAGIIQRTTKSPFSAVINRLTSIGVRRDSDDYRDYSHCLDNNAFAKAQCELIQQDVWSSDEDKQRMFEQLAQKLTNW